VKVKTTSDYIASAFQPYLRDGSEEVKPEFRGWTSIIITLIVVCMVRVGQSVEIPKELRRGHRGPVTLDISKILHNVLAPIKMLLLDVFQIPYRRNQLCQKQYSYKSWDQKTSGPGANPRYNFSKGIDDTWHVSGDQLLAIK
jgi:hypothetical protein